MQPIGVVHVITGLGQGGAERMLQKLVSRMDSSRFRSAVISLSDEGVLGSHIRSLGVPVHALGMRANTPDPLPLVKLALLLRRFRPQLVQTWMPHADLMGTLAARAAFVPHLAWNIRCSDVDYSKYGASTRWAVKLLSRASSVPDVVVANSHAGKVSHERLGFAPRSWRIIPNGFDVERFRPLPEQRHRLREQLALPPDAFVIGLVARYDVMKDHATALAALRLLPEAHLVAAGRGVTPDNPALAAADLRGRLHLLGPQDDVRNIFAGCDIATLTSAFGEGFPNAIGEAMACGIPVVTTDVGDAGAIVGDTGLVVEPQSPAALASAWQIMLREGEMKRRDRGSRARDRVIEHWSLDAVVRTYERVYSEVVGAPRKKRPFRSDTAREVESAKAAPLA